MKKEKDTQQPAAFYTQELEAYRARLVRLKRQLNLSSLLRLTVFVTGAIAVYLALGHIKLMLGLLIGTIAIFLWLITRHSKISYQKKLVQALIDINETELAVGQRQFNHLPDGAQFVQEQDYFSRDIDLFGQGSFFQYLNRTALDSGRDYLASMLVSNEIDAIPDKQQAIQELAHLPHWRQQFSGVAQLVTTTIAATTVVDWLKDYQKTLPSSGILWSRLFTGLSLTALTLYFLDVIAGYYVFGVFGLGLVISGRYLKRVGSLATYTTQAQSTFDQYYKLLEAIENQEFESVLLSRKRNPICNTTQSASGVLRKFSRLLDRLDQRNNILIGFIANGFFLRDLGLGVAIERWIVAYKDEVAVWFDAITFFDAYNSLANYSFNHPSHSFPTITDTAVTIEAKAAAHPLLHPEQAVPNDFKILKEEFFIITGANMAGKSTFLRTVALQIVMGNMGLPVCAASASYTPIKLISSMRTTDSLTDDESYFFSELKRLKFIVSQIQQDRYFIILDEILKGTNSTDKAIGSRKFIDKLVTLKATGIIATHDLSLCTAAQELDQVFNYYFDARIEDDELYFDYTFKPGICQNMNASFLLKKMNIVE
jgi:ABC-type multidrug transport system fused ATPase/permease subunit